MSSEDSTIQLASIGGNNIIEVMFTSKSKAIKKVSDTNNEIDEVNIIDIDNLGSVKISF